MQQILRTVPFFTSMNRNIYNLTKACHSGGLRINLDRLGIFNVSRNIYTRAFPFIASINEATGRGCRIEPASSCSEARLSHGATAAG